ncbi:MAG TPA: hypothetical protein VGJ05_13290 [Fimbriiglobus sp.]|jgi:hypothetical protein
MFLFADDPAPATIWFTWQNILSSTLFVTIVGGIGKLILVWWNRKQPFVRIDQLESTSLVNIAESVRARLKVTMDDRVFVTALSQSVFQIYNTSSETCKDVLIRFVFPYTTKYLTHEAHGCDAVANTLSTTSLEGFPTTAIEVSVPFLNSYKPHKSVVILKVVCDGAANPTTVTPPHAAGFHVIITNEPNSRGFVALFTMKLAT